MRQNPFDTSKSFVKIALDLVMEEAEFQQTCAKYEMLKFNRNPSKEIKEKVEFHIENIKKLSNILKELSEYAERIANSK